MTTQKTEIVDLVLKGCEEWQQGDYALDCGDLVYRDILETDKETGEENDLVLDGPIIGFAVVSQTCDIVRDPTIINHVTVCPLVEISPEGLSRTEKGLVPRYGIIENAPTGLVVDFTRTMSISKQLLVGWKRERGCPNEAQQLAFAQSLERFFGRFAFPDSFNESIDTLRKSIIKRYGKNSEFGASIESVKELRVFPHSSWNSASPIPIPITFIAILDDEDDRVIKDRNIVYEQLKSQIEKISWKPPFQAHSNILHVTTLVDMTAADYLNSYPLDLNAISFSKRFS